MRGGAAAIAASAMMASCVVVMPIHPAPEPPLIEWAGVPAEIRIGAASVVYVLADGATIEVDFEPYRVLTDDGWSGELVVLGSDADGLFIAGFMRQDGLPNDCYVENVEGIDRGNAIEIHGVLWPKTGGFEPAEAVALDSTYPPGTRFCFDRDGEVTSTIDR